MKIKSSDGKTFDLSSDFIEWFIYKFSEKGFEIKNKYAFVRGFMKRWKSETIEKWLEKYEKERKSFLGGLLYVELPF